MIREARFSSPSFALLRFKCALVLRFKCALVLRFKCALAPEGEECPSKPIIQLWEYWIACRRE